MKKIVIAFALLVSSTIFSQVLPTTGEIFLEKMKAKEQIKGFVDNYIDKLASESNGITAAQWATIKSKIDYSPYLLGIESVLYKNYPGSQLQDIITANEIAQVVNPAEKFIFKPTPAVQEQLYNISRIFGKQLNVQIKKLIEKL